MNLRRGDVVTVKMVFATSSSDPDTFYVHPFGDPYSMAPVHKDQVLEVLCDHQPGDVVVDIADRDLVYTVVFVKDDVVVLENQHGFLKIGAKRSYRRQSQENTNVAA